MILPLREPDLATGCIIERKSHSPFEANDTTNL